MPGAVHDQWAQWVLSRQFGGDPEFEKRAQEELRKVRDMVLRNASVAERDVVLDVGCGDGLIAFGALERVGEGGKVIFSDISMDLLDHDQALAREMGVLHRCAFVHAPANDLALLSDGSVDVVTTRSVLIYVPAKLRAFQEFRCVLKPGGRLSIYEPINRFSWPEPEEQFSGFDVSSVHEIARKIHGVYLRIQPPDTDPMTDFDERGLITLAEQAGFGEIHLDLRLEIKPAQPQPWALFLRKAGNPRIPTLEEAMNEVLTHEETERFTSHLRPLVESGQGTSRTAVAFLWALK